MLATVMRLSTSFRFIFDCFVLTGPLFGWMLLVELVIANPFDLLPFSLSVTRIPLTEFRVALTISFSNVAFA